ncbi:MAG: aminopeptidase, partial [Candidatus Marinimicrobia bacterium]|nr:aminopeptidase [Candidatus Neomarinimicrobiota bacterium]
MQANIRKQDLETWADYLLNHSLEEILPDDVVMVKGEHITWPLMSVLQDKIFAAGAIADICLVPPDNNRGQVWGASITRHGTVEQIQRVPAWHRDRYEAMTKYIEILGAESPELFANLPEATSQALMKADMPFKQIRLSKPWVLTLFPTQAFADLEGMSLEEYTKIVVGTSLTDPKKLNDIEEPIAQLMGKSATVSIETEHPKNGRLLTLTMSIKDRFPIKCVGERNFPDGEVYTSPDANSVEGEIFVDLPVYYNGVTIQGIYLKLEKGRIVDYSAETAFDTLKNIIETDEGSHRIGEVALGMNQGLTVALKHPLFVEKVGGTLHIAIGESYPD